MFFRLRVQGLGCFWGLVRVHLPLPSKDSFCLRLLRSKDPIIRRLWGPIIRRLWGYFDAKG